MVSKLHTRLFCAAEAVLLSGVLVAAALLSSDHEWRPLWLVALLLLLSLGGQRMVFQIRGQHLSAGLVGQVLAMCLLGPAVAVVVSVAAAISISFRRELP